MSTVAPQVWNNGLVGELVARGIHAVRQETVRARRLLQQLDWSLLDEHGPLAESSLQRGFRVRRPVDDHWGRSESIDPDNVGDIADEGMGHRG